MCCVPPCNPCVLRLSCSKFTCSRLYVSYSVLLRVDSSAYESTTFSVNVRIGEIRTEWFKMESYSIGKFVINKPLLIIKADFSFILNTADQRYSL